ncbi:MAG: glutamine synthetase family protein [Lachnospiraceae bacterium]|nr:glutamine synthetase family protein [Lachnospiraceae bacterium]
MAGYSKEEALEYVQENDIKFIRLAFCDIFGRHKNVSIMPDELEKAFEIGIGFDSFRIDGFEDPVYQDLFLRPDPATLNTLPWRPQQGGVIRFYCDVVTADGQSFPYDARQFLRETLKECKKMGFGVRVALRSEFYLFKTDEDGNPTDIPWDNGGYYDIAPLDRGENIRREICLNLEEMGLHPETSHHEAGPGQNEIDFQGADALRSAENFITYKNVVTSISARNGVYASFAPKPLEGKSGNGLHLKIDLMEAGQSLDESNPQMVEQFMAGVLNRMRDITIFLNTTRESYLRFGENEAPKYITWSTQNRSRLLRVPIVRGKKEGFVLRSPDSEINPYLAYAMLIQAGLEGIRQNEELPKPQEKSSRLVEEKDFSEYQQLPLSLEEALDCAKESSFLQNSVCSEIASRFFAEIERREFSK